MVMVLDTSGSMRNKIHDVAAAVAHFAATAEPDDDMFLMRFSGASEVVVWGTGAPRREFLHVDDFADAAVFLMERPEDLGLINVGVGWDLSIAELAQLVARTVAYQGRIVFDTSKPDGTPRKLLDISKLRSLGWQAKIPLEQGIQSTYEWFCGNSGAVRELPSAR